MELSVEHGKSKDMEANKMDIDDLFPVVGEFGRYQKLLTWLICIPIFIMSGLQSFKQVILAGLPLHWCKPPPSLQMGNISYDLMKHLSIPLERNAFGKLIHSSCRIYDVNYTDVLANLLFSDTILNGSVSDNDWITHLNRSQWPTTECKNGWDYETEYYDKTVVTQWNLVCNMDSIPTIAQCAMHFGGMLGVILFGYTSDRWGRKTSFFLCLGLSVVTEITTALSPGFIFWAVIRFLAGFTIPAIYQVTFILIIELVGPSSRVFVSVIAYVFYSVGLFVIAAIAYFIRSWNILALVTSIPFILFFICWKFLPESPRWLMTQGRVDEALNIFEKCAKINKTTFPESYRTHLKEISKSVANGTAVTESKKNNVSLRNLFQTPYMRRKTLLVTFCWFTNMTVYAGLNLYAPILGTNPYVSLMLGALVELPAHALMVWVMQVWTRRWSLCTLMILGGTSCALTIAVPPEQQHIELGLFLIGKFAISATYVVIFAFGSELFPTEVRGIGLGFAAYTGMFGSTIIPFVNYEGEQYKRLPLLVFGVLVILGGLSALGLPETLHKSLPQTVKEAEQPDKQMTFKEFFLCFMLKKSSKSATDK